MGNRMKYFMIPLISILISMMLLQGCSPTINQTGERPNFVWIVSEDNSKHYMELFDPNGIATPHIGEMALHGIIFNRAFSNAPVCSVARSTLISSCYAPRTGTQYHRRSELVPMPPGVQMFPALLRDAGYYTTNNSKEDYNYVKAADVWDESSTKAHWRHRGRGQPFFHMESHPATHESNLHFRAELMDRYSPVTDPDRVHLFPNHPDTELFRFTSAYYRDRVLAVDTIVGKVLAQLEQDGLLENTFVFYFSDHGGVLPGSKGYLYETGLHIPLVVRIPEKFKHLVGFRPGTETDGFVSFVDFGPTVLQLAGIEIPAGIDGIPFMGQGISSSDLDSRQTTYGYADRFDEKYDMVRSIRKGRFKYLRNYQPFNFDGLQNNYRYKCLAFQQWRDLFLAGELDEVQRQFFEPREPEALYDLENDPYETFNLAGDRNYREKLAEMRGLLGEWVRKMPDLSFYTENKLRKEAFENPVVFGQEHRQQIGELADIADLELLPPDQAREGISKALSSGDPARIYWGLIVCSCFGGEAAPFIEEARALCSHEDRLVRTRAAEFLGIIGEEDPAPVIIQALYESDDGPEALLILNSLVVLMDGPHGYTFELDRKQLKQTVLQDEEVMRRMEYLQSRTDQAKNL
jgi:arylsulfatase A-like enzyme